MSTRPPTEGPQAVPGRERSAAAAGGARWGRRLLPLALFFIALMPRGIYFVQLHHSPTYDHPEGGDSIFYHRLATGEPGPRRAYFHSPLYRWFCTATYRVTGPHIAAVRIIQHVLGALCAVFLYYITLILFRRRAMALAAGVLQAFFGPAIFYEGQLIPDGILPFLLALTVLIMLFYLRRAQPRWGLILGLAIGLSALARATVLIWLPALLLGAVLAPRRQWSLLWRKEGLLLLGVVLVVLPATVRNYLVERDVVLITANAGLNFYIGNNPHARGTYNLPPGLWFKPGDPLADFSGVKAATRALGYQPRSSALSRWWTKKALSYLKENPARGLALLPSKVAWWVNDYEFPQLYNYYGYMQICPILKCLPRAGIIVAPALLGFCLFPWVSRRRTPRVLLLCALLFMVSFLPFFVAGRYRAPWIVLCMPFAAWVLHRIFTRLCQKRWDRAVSLLMALAASAAFCFWPPEQKPTLAAQFYAFGNAAAGQQDFKQARRWYQQTIAEEENYWLVQAKLGYTLFRLGQLEQAAAVLRRAARLSPRSGEVQYALGLVHLGQDKLSRAEQSFLAATRFSPGMAPAWVQLAEVKLKRGQWTEAITAYQSALVMARKDEPWVRSVRKKLAELEARRREVRE